MSGENISTISRQYILLINAVSFSKYCGFIVY